MNNNKIALLIDAENISAGYIDKILEELGKRGTVVYKRVYADWTKAVDKPRTRKSDTYNLWEVLYRWYTVLQEKGLTPMHQPQNTIGKNSSDIYLIIDAMDILYAGVADTFCIVSSDGDFTRLAVRLLEAGKDVIVMGEAQTPRSVRHVGDFVLLEEKDNKIKPLPTAPAKPQTAAATSGERPKTMFAQLVSTKDDRRDAQPSTAVAEQKPAAPQQKAQQPKQQAQPQQPQQAKQQAKQQQPKQQQQQPKKEQPKPAVTEAKPLPVVEPIHAGADYDNQIIASMLEFIAASKDGELTYQRLLSLLRKKHPDCEVIKVGESPIELFKALPQLSYRQEKATYYFSIKKSDAPTTVEVNEEPAPIEEKPVEAVAEADKAAVEEDKPQAEEAKPAPKRRRAPRKKAAPKTEQTPEGDVPPTNE